MKLNRIPGEVVFRGNETITVVIEIDGEQKNLEIPIKFFYQLEPLKYGKAIWLYSESEELKISSREREPILIDQIEILRKIIDEF